MQHTLRSSGSGYDLLEMTSRSYVTKEKDTFYFIKIKGLVLANITFYRVKRQWKEWETVFANHKSAE